MMKGIEALVRNRELPHTDAKRLNEVKPSTALSVMVMKVVP